MKEAFDLLAPAKEYLQKIEFPCNSGIARYINKVEIQIQKVEILMFYYESTKTRNGLGNLKSR